jgi:hypothetical protein
MTLDISRLSMLIAFWNKFIYFCQKFSEIAQHEINVAWIFQCHCRHVEGAWCEIIVQQVWRQAHNMVRGYCVFVQFNLAVTLNMLFVAWSRCDTLFVLFCHVVLELVDELTVFFFLYWFRYCFLVGIRNDQVLKKKFPFLYPNKLKELDLRVTS